MKVSLFALLALGSAQEDSGTTMPEQSTNDYGYEAPQETYTPEPETYAAAPAYVAAPQVCVVCDVEAPCWNGATCSPKTFAAASYEPTTYGAAQEAYPATQEQTGYRRLAEDYATEGEQTFGETYAAPHYTIGGSCPCGSVDTNYYRVTNTVILWIAFALLFIPAFYFMCRAFEETAGTNAEDGTSWNSMRVEAGIVCSVASLAYLTMALGYGYVVKCNGRNFYYARYVDWAITTPIMLYEMARFSGENNVTQWFLVILDIFMIVAGLIGELIDGDEKWAFFGFSMLVFIPIMYMLFEIRSNVASFREGNALSSAKSFLTQILIITIISWMGYPIIWILATVESSVDSCGHYAASHVAQEGYRKLQDIAAATTITKVGVISVQGEGYAYTVLDIIAKSLMGFIICCWDPKETAVPDCETDLTTGGIFPSESASSAQKVMRKK